jgi:hypothetical protein
MPESAAANPVAPADLQLPFLEGRTYLHGTTLFDAMLPYVPAGASLSFKISHRLNTDRVRLQEAAGAAPSTASASLRWTFEGRGSTLAVYPLSASGQVTRQPYPEGEVDSRARVEAGSAILENPLPFSFVATLIPLFKVLLRQAVHVSRPGQWMFTRLDLDAVPKTFIPLRLTLSGVVPNALARAQIACEGGVIGMLYFSWVALA